MFRIILWLALIPSFLLIWLIYRMDKIEKEPIGLMIKLFIAGALTTIAASILESIGLYAIGFVLPEVDWLYNLIFYFIVVGGSEELVKYFALKKLTWNQEAFNFRFDGIVYAVAVSLGFAAAENFRYMLGMGVGVIGIRAITAVPMHCITGIFMGHYYGEARRLEDIGDPERARNWRRLAVIVPLLLHGFYDFCASMESSFFSTLFLVYVIVIDIVSYRMVRHLAQNDIPA